MMFHDNDASLASSPLEIPDHRIAIMFITAIHFPKPESLIIEARRYGEFLVNLYIGSNAAFGVQIVKDCSPT